MEAELKKALKEILEQSKANATDLAMCERTLRGHNGDIGLVAEVAALGKSVKWLSVAVWGIVVFLVFVHAERVALLVGAWLSKPLFLP